MGSARDQLGLKLNPEENELSFLKFVCALISSSQNQNFNNTT